MSYGNVSKIACILCIFIVGTTYAAPLFPQAMGGSSAGGLNSLTDVLSNIDIPAVLRTINSVVKVLEVFCPPLAQVVDNVIQNVTSQAFKVFGGLLLRGGGGLSGNAGDGGGDDSESSVRVVLPTFAPEDYDYDEESNESGATTTTMATGQIVDSDKNMTAATHSPPLMDAEAAKEDISNVIVKRHIRIARDVEAASDSQVVPNEDVLQPADDLANVEADEDADRNKRFLPFGLGGGDPHGGGGSSGGGSGNFLFDIIRLVAGSGATEETDEHENAPGGIAELEVGKGIGIIDGQHHNGEHIPGPITRLFVIANRGIANLVQDLILRLAQTSERLVNFKARLITSLI